MCAPMEPRGRAARTGVDRVAVRRKRRPTADESQRKVPAPGFTKKKKRVHPNSLKNLKDHQKKFQPGQSGNPAGTVVFNPQKRFYAAILKYEKKYGRDILDLFIQRAYQDPSLLAVALSKLVPSKQQVSVGPEDISVLLDRVADIIAEFVPESKRDAALARIRELEERSSGGKI